MSTMDGLLLLNPDLCHSPSSSLASALVAFIQKGCPCLSLLHTRLLAYSIAPVVGSLTDCCRHLQFFAGSGIDSFTGWGCGCGKLSLHADLLQLGLGKHQPVLT